MANDERICADCKTKPSVHDVRRRPLCQDCFEQYINGKIIKKVESYRWKYIPEGLPQRRLLLPLSGGIASLLLLHILDRLLAKQRSQQNRTNFELVCCHIVSDLDDKDDHLEKISKWWDRVKNQYSNHYYHAPFKLRNVAEYDPSIKVDLQTLGLPDASYDISQLLSSTVTRTATARADLRSILLKRFVVSVAKINGCESILFGHTSSRLASLTLSEVAKGRGSSTASETSDGLSDHGTEYKFPSRDLFSDEIELYAESKQLHDGLLLRDLVFDDKTDRSDMIISLKSTSIDTLMQRYIDGQGEKYPSLMANVVRTTGKLQQAPGGFDGPRCAVCRTCIRTGSDDNPPKLCYGCERMKQDIKME